MASDNRLPDEIYLRVFEQHAEGRLILDELTERFARNPYVRGGHDAERHSCFMAGQSSVIELIQLKIERAKQRGPADDNGNE